MRKITETPNKIIADALQKAITATTPGTHKILGISKLTNAVRIQLQDEASVKAITTQANIDWNKALGPGTKLHTPRYAIVVHGAPATLNDTVDQDTIAQIEQGNNMPSGTITKIANLRKRPTGKGASTPRSHSIVAYLNNPQQANRCITNGIYIDYTHHTSVEHFHPDTQIIQCYNCHAYGHRARDCKNHVRCGRCSGEHNTNGCKATKAHCSNCKEEHEAWNSECTARIAEKKQRQKAVEHAPILFRELTGVEGTSISR
jgi:hypothetical protein